MSTYDRQSKILSVSITPAEVATIVCAWQEFDVPGVAVGDAVSVSPYPTGNAVGVGAAYVSAADKVKICFCNPTAGALTPAAGAYLFNVTRP